MELTKRLKPSGIDSDECSEAADGVARESEGRNRLRLVKMWLECAVEENDGRGRKTRTTEA